MEFMLDNAEIISHHARVISRVRHFHSAQRVIGIYAVLDKQHVVFIPRKNYR